jgi:hypothetical protein
MKSGDAEYDAVPDALLVVRFRFALGQVVRVVAIGAAATVVARCERAVGGVDYRVVYWVDGVRHEDWLYGFELESGE